MSSINVSSLYAETLSVWTTLSRASRILIAYGVVMALAASITFWISTTDDRTIRDVGIWVKPMKFMAATAVFSWTTIWLTCVANSSVGQTTTFTWITALIISTSLFEVAYITFQGARGLESHYNNTDPLHTLLFGLMAIAAIGLTFSQAWLAWEIWKEQATQKINPLTLAVLIGLVLTFVLATLSGFLLGGNQPPAGEGLPIVGWHLQKDIRPAHFLGVHAQQLIPLIGIVAERYLGSFGAIGVVASSAAYVIACASLTWMGLST
jgi:hypothetical protein